MRLFLVLVAFGAGLSGCATDCQSSCEKIWAENECATPDPAIFDDETRDARIAECVQHCEGAMLKHGEPGSYDPNLAVSQSASPCLDNQRQAAMWMACVDQAACENLEKNVCAPIFNAGTCNCDGQQCE